MKLKWLLMNQEGGGEGQGAAGGSGEGEGEGNNQTAIDPAEYEGLKSQLASFQESISKLEANSIFCLSCPYYALNYLLIGLPLRKSHSYCTFHPLYCLVWKLIIKELIKQ